MSGVPILVEGASLSVLVVGGGPVAARKAEAFAARMASRVSRDSASNSLSRLRSGFSPSAVRKSVQRDRMLPATCFMMSAMLLASASIVAKSCSSVICAIALSAWSFSL